MVLGWAGLPSWDTHICRTHWHTRRASCHQLMRLNTILNTRLRLLIFVLESLDTTSIYIKKNIYQTLMSIFQQFFIVVRLVCQLERVHVWGVWEWREWMLSVSLSLVSVWGTHPSDEHNAHSEAQQTSVLAQTLDSPYDGVVTWPATKTTVAKLVPQLVFLLTRDGSRELVAFLYFPWFAAL